MRIGDLVHNPRYPYWGMGIVVDREEEDDGLILVHWLGNGTLEMDMGWGTLEMDMDWMDEQDLEIL